MRASIRLETRLRTLEWKTTNARRWRERVHTRRQGEEDWTRRDVIICVRIVRLAGMAESFDISQSLIKLERIIAARREGDPRSDVVVRRLLPNAASRLTFRHHLRRFVLSPSARHPSDAETVSTLLLYLRERYEPSTDEWNTLATRHESAIGKELKKKNTSIDRNFSEYSHRSSVRSNHG